MTAVSITERRALVLFVREFLDLLAEFRILQKQGSQASVTRLCLDEMHGVLKELPSYLYDEYYSILRVTTQESVPRPAEISETVTELLQPARKRFVSTIRSELNIAVGDD